MEVALSWLGPYVIVPQPGFACVLDHPAETRHPGLYLWTIEYEGGYLINYVGETGRDLWSRLVENVAWSFGGRGGGVSDPVQFRQGRIVPLAQFCISEFLADYARLSAAIYELYSKEPTGVTATATTCVTGTKWAGCWPISPTSLRTPKS